jgi:hypothetical protein
MQSFSWLYVEFWFGAAGQKSAVAAATDIQQLWGRAVELDRLYW